MLLEMERKGEEGRGGRREWGWDRWRRWVRRREVTSGVGVFAAHLMDSQQLIIIIKN